MRLEARLAKILIWIRESHLQLIDFETTRNRFEERLTSAARTIPADGWSAVTCSFNEIQAPFPWGRPDEWPWREAR